MTQSSPLAVSQSRWFPASPSLRFLFRGFPFRALAMGIGAILIASIPASAGGVYCSDLTYVSATSGWSTVQKDRCINTNPINLGGKVYAKGLGTHAPSEIVYALGGKYVSFSATVGIDDGTQGKGSSEFLVYADDSLVFKSGVIKGGMTPATIAVSVAGRNKLRLVTTIGPDTYDMDDADWADALLVEKPAVSLLPRQAGPGIRTRENGNTMASPSSIPVGTLPVHILFDLRGVHIPVGARGKTALFRLPAP